MIGLLRGRIAGELPDGTLVLDVRDVGYEVVVPQGALGRVTPDGDGLVTLHVHTHVREDAIVLFGFARPADRTAFRVLISIPNVGPKLALAVLGAVSARELARIVTTGSAADLTRIPGVGKKTAARVVLELKDKLAPLLDVPGDEPPVAQGPAAAGSATRELLRDALLQMGWRAGQVDRVVAAVGDEPRPLGELVRDALKLLAP